jgi:hypothetical protein
MDRLAGEKIIFTAQEILQATKIIISVAEGIGWGTQ